MVGLGISEPSTVLKWNWQNPWWFAFFPRFLLTSQSLPHDGHSEFRCKLWQHRSLWVFSGGLKKHAKTMQKWLGKEAKYDRVIDWMSKSLRKNFTCIIFQWICCLCFCWGHVWSWDVFAKIGSHDQQNCGFSVYSKFSHHQFAIIIHSNHIIHHIKYMVREYDSHCLYFLFIVNMA